MIFRKLCSLLLLMVFLCHLPAAASPPILSFPISKALFDLAPYVDMAAGSAKTLNGATWYSENVLLAHSCLGDGFFYGPYLLDLKKRRRTPLSALNAIIRNTKGPEWQLSPDRRWVLWHQGRMSPPQHFVATRLDGSKSVRWPVTVADGEGPIFWLPKSHQWGHILLTEDNSRLREVHLFDLHHPNRKRVLPLPPLEQTDLLGVLPDGSVLLMDLQGSRTRQLSFAKISFKGNHALVRRWSIPFPSQGDIEQLCLSQNGQRIAYLVLQRPARSGGDPKSATLYVSTVHGKQRHAIGIIRFTQEYDQYNTLLQTWFLDNKRVLLQIGKHLYAVPAP